MEYKKVTIEIYGDTLVFRMIKNNDEIYYFVVNDQKSDIMLHSNHSSQSEDELDALILNMNIFLDRKFSREKFYPIDDDFIARLNSIPKFEVEKIDDDRDLDYDDYLREESHFDNTNLIDEWEGNSLWGGRKYTSMCEDD